MTVEFIVGLPDFTDLNQLQFRFRSKTGFETQWFDFSFDEKTQTWRAYVELTSELRVSKFKDGWFVERHSAHIDADDLPAYIAEYLEPWE